MNLITLRRITHYLQKSGWNSSAGYHFLRLEMTKRIREENQPRFSLFLITPSMKPNSTSIRYKTYYNLFLLFPKLRQRECPRKVFLAKMDTLP